MLLNTFILIGIACILFSLMALYVLKVARANANEHIATLRDPFCTPEQRDALLVKMLSAEDYEQYQQTPDTDEAFLASAIHNLELSLLSLAHLQKWAWRSLVLFSLLVMLLLAG